MIAVNNIEQVFKAGTITTRGINSILFVNQGNVTAVLNTTLKIRPGSSFGFSQVDPNIIDGTNYQVMFDLNDSYTTGTQPDLIIVTTTLTSAIPATATTNCN